MEKFERVTKSCIRAIATLTFCLAACSATMSLRSSFCSWLSLSFNCSSYLKNTNKTANSTTASKFCTLAKLPDYWILFTDLPSLATTRVTKTCSADQSKFKVLTVKLQSLPAHLGTFWRHLRKHLKGSKVSNTYGHFVFCSFENYNER